MATLDRILARCVEVDRGHETPCWEWQGYHNSKGYGCLRHLGRYTRTHRVVYELMVAEIPADLEMDHLCRNTACARPDHVEPVTDAVNRERRVASRTRCKSGRHRMTPANTGVRNHCRACRREGRRLRYLRGRPAERAA